MDVKNSRPVLVPISKNAQAKKLTAKDPIVSNGAFNQIQDIKDDFEVLADGSQTSQNSSVCSHESQLWKAQNCRGRR
uniref:Uncharacterized protein n=1 Tax=Ditylenchus dipsaci TaxID=166011 RepID=A0A915EWC4_9BILA